MTLRALDLFCGAGGATKGLQRAGYHVTGVDIRPQPRYCGDEFHQADALTFPLEGYDLIWASPPCQAYSLLRRLHPEREYPDLIAPIRARLMAAGSNYVIENVEGAPLISAVRLCGSHFGLGSICRDGKWRELRRHRYFERPVFSLSRLCRHRGEPLGVYGHGGGQAKTVWNGGSNRGYMGTLKERRQAMGIDWMNVAELSEAIPPAYSEFIARQLIGATA